MTGRGVRLVVVAGLSVGAALQAWTSLRTKSMTFDELTYIPSGYTYVVTGDYRMNPEHPPLAKLLAGTALVSEAPPLDLSHPSWGEADQWAFGRHFFQTVGAATGELVERARLPGLLLVMAMVVFAYLMATEIYGPRAGLLAAWLCAFSPNLLAHGRLATTDFPQALFVLVTAYAFLRFIRAPSISAGLGVGVALGLALLSKYSAILLLGLVGVWAVAAVTVWRPGDGGGRRPPNRWSTRATDRVVFMGGSLASMLLVAALVVSAGYGSPGDPGPFLRGLRVLYTNVHADLPTYFAGTFHRDGVPYYFLAAFLLKAPLGVLALLALRLADQIRRRSLGLLESLYLLLPAAVFFAVMTVSALQFGVRYVLPALPLLFVYAAGAAESPSLRGRVGTLALAVLALVFAGASLRTHPHYIPFFNVLAGGPSQGIEWLDDSNVDWGQDLPLLATWLEESDVDDAVVVPMALYDPALYGVEGTWSTPEAVLPLLTAADPPPGVYAVSAHLLTRARWGRRPVVDPLRDRTPRVVLGHSLHVFDLRRP